MLFNSLPFLGLFLPLTLAGYYLIGRRFGGIAPMGFLAAASLLFYAVWNPAYLPLLVGSIAFNYGVGRLLLRRPSGLLLGFGIAANLGNIALFKYADFAASSWNAAVAADLPLPGLLLPLAISFYTFQQIAWLVEARRGEAEAGFVRYLLFVTFFPQLIAGPIVRFVEVADQFAAERFGRFDIQMFACGWALFALGLAKKVLLADPLASYASPVFEAADMGLGVTTGEAWVGAAAYSFQLYFDFSGYSDMAVGLGLMFGVHLPWNFDAPYRARSIVDFWRRWHMTLSRFLRDFLYIPLGGNRHGPARRWTNLMIVMVLGGLWHGAGWTFVLWGALHGLYLVADHALGALWPATRLAPLRRLLAPAATFLAVVLAWVLFRAETLEGAATLYRAMAGEGGGDGSLIAPGEVLGLAFYLALSAAIVWTMPTSIRIEQRLSAAFASSGRTSVPLVAIGLGAAFGAAFVAVFVGIESEFIYFQF